MCLLSVVSVTSRSLPPFAMHPRTRNALRAMPNRDMTEAASTCSLSRSPSLSAGTVFWERSAQVARAHAAALPITRPYSWTSYLVLLLLSNLGHVVASTDHNECTLKAVPINSLSLGRTTVAMQISALVLGSSLSNGQVDDDCRGHGE